MAEGVVNLNIVSLSEMTDLTEKMWLELMDLVPQNAKQLYIVDNLSYYSS